MHERIYPEQNGLSDLARVHRPMKLNYDLQLSHPVDPVYSEYTFQHILKDVLSIYTHHLQISTTSISSSCLFGPFFAVRYSAHEHSQGSQVK